MGLTIHLPEWYLNYAVAAFGVYATVLVESFCLIFGIVENASPLSISILTNGTAVLLAGLDSNFSASFAILRICLTTIYLIYGILITSRTEENFDGTYAVLCSVAHVAYTMLLYHREHSGPGDTSVSQEPKEKAEASSQSRSDDTLSKETRAMRVSRKIVFEFGDAFHLEGAMPITMLLGTTMMYRVFDFDLGFGLLFAFFSAACSTVVLCLMNFARLRGRHINFLKAIQRLVGMLIPVGTFCYILFVYSDLDIIELSWWRVTFGIVWLPFLFMTMYSPCQFFLHVTIFPCTTCRQHEQGLDRLSEETTICPWQKSTTIPKLDNDRDQLDHTTIFRIKRRKGRDLVERYWINDQPFFQVSPRSFPITFIICTSLLLAGTYVDALRGISVTVSFYVALLFSLAATGHGPVYGSSRVGFVPLKYNSVDWSAAVSAVIATAVVHLFLGTYVLEAVLSFVAPLMCTCLTAMLLGGVSKDGEKPDQGHKDSPFAENAANDRKAEQTGGRVGFVEGLDTALEYSSSWARCVDLRVLILGISVTCVDFICNNEYGKWPISTLTCLFTTIIIVFLENFAPTRGDLEPSILFFATVALLTIFSKFNFLDLFGLWDNEFDDYSGHSLPIKDALWFALLHVMIMNSRRLIKKRSDRELPPREGSSQKIKNHLLLNIDLKKFRINCRWQLRNAQVSIVILLAWASSLAAEDWPLPLDTTVSSLGLFLCVVGFQIHPTREAEVLSVAHSLAFGISLLATIFTTGFYRRGYLDYGSEWQVATWTTLTSYALISAVLSRLPVFKQLAREYDTETCHPADIGVSEEEQGRHKDEKKGYVEL